MDGVDEREYLVEEEEEEDEGEEEEAAEAEVERVRFGPGPGGVRYVLAGEGAHGAGRARGLGFVGARPGAEMRWWDWTRGFRDRKRLMSWRRATSSVLGTWGGRTMVFEYVKRVRTMAGSPSLDRASGKSGGGGRGGQEGLWR